MSPPPNPDSSMGASSQSPALAIRVVAAMITRQDGRYLITQRRTNAVLPLLWEFPGGRIEAGESHAEALQREVAHRLGVTVSVGVLVSYVQHHYERYSLDLYVYECQLLEQPPVPLNVNALAWVSSEDFERYEFTPADERSVSQLLGLETS